MSEQLDFLTQPYHRTILQDEIRSASGEGSDGRECTCCSFGKAHLGEVSVTVWPKELKEICEKKNVHLLV